MKRILIVSFDFPPQGGTGAIRVTKFVKYLPEFGWQPVVVCSDTNWNRDESLARDVPPETPVYRVGWPRWVQALRPGAPGVANSTIAATPRSGWMSSLKQMLAKAARRALIPDVNVLWVSNALRVCEQVLHEHPCDAVLTTSPPHSVHLVGRGLRSRLEIPWVADFRDVWTAENPALRRLGKIHHARQRRVERQVLEACDRAVMVTEPLTRQTQRVFGPKVSPKCTTITNGFDPDDFALPLAASVDNKFVITYVGTILGSQTNNAFPEGLRLALEQSAVFRNAVQAHFVGQLAPEYHARLKGVENYVEITGFVPHDAAIEAMRHAHLLLLILSSTDLARMIFTNKFFEYLAARRPILALVPSGIISDIIEQEKIGSVASPDNAPAIAQALLAMFESVRARPDGYYPSEALLARFDRRGLTRRLAAVLDEITGK